MSGVSGGSYEYQDTFFNNATVNQTVYARTVKAEQALFYRYANHGARSATATGADANNGKVNVLTLENGEIGIVNVRRASASANGNVISAMYSYMNGVGSVTVLQVTPDSGTGPPEVDIVGDQLRATLGTNSSVQIWMSKMRLN